MLYIHFALPYAKFSVSFGDVVYIFCVEIDFNKYNETSLELLLYRHFIRKNGNENKAGMVKANTNPVNFY